MKLIFSISLTCLCNKLNLKFRLNLNFELKLIFWLNFLFSQSTFTFYIICFVVSYLFRIKKINQILLGKELFSYMRRHLFVWQKGTWMIQKGRLRLNPPKSDVFLTISVQVSKKSFFRKVWKGHFSTKHLIPGYFIFLR